jgi:hypothetical protein
VWWIYNTVPNRAGFESGYGSEAGYGFFFFMQMLFWIMILRNRFFWFFLLLNIFGTQSSEQLQKKIQPPACLGHRLHVLAFFSLRGIVLQKCGRDINCSLDYGSSWVKNSDISPTKIEQHFGGLWNFETPLMLLSLSQKKVVHSMRWKICFFFKYTANSFGMYVL